MVWFIPKSWDSCRCGDGFRSSGVSILVAALLIGWAGASRACDRASFRVVLDVGHTERAPGATSARGVTELTFNRRLAATVTSRLAHDGFTNVTVLSGHLNGRSDLLDRSARANAVHPDAFLSLHHDSVQRSYLEPWIAEDGSSQMHSDRFSGFSLFISRRNTEPSRSLALARAISNALTVRGLHFTRHHAEPIAGENRPWADAVRGIYAFDDLVVLKHTDAPAVLLESGVIVNRDEERILGSRERRDLVADALADAFAVFCDKTGR